MSTPVLQPCPLHQAILLSVARQLFITSLNKMMRSSCKAICFALSVRLCAHIGQAMSKCSVQELQTSAKSLQHCLLALRQAALTLSSRGSHTAHPALCLMTSKQCASVCVWCHRWPQSLIWHLYCLSLWTIVTARRFTCAALRDTDCPPQPPPALLMSVSLPFTQCMLPKCLLA